MSIRTLTGHFGRYGALCLTALVASCAANANDGEGAPNAESTTAASDVALTRDLNVGDRGPDVEFLNRYLLRYGYFPNPELAKANPRWRPIVDARPSAMDVYDEHTAEAVLAYQGYMGVEPTGFADEATRVAVATPRCAHPDGVQAIDPKDKFLPIQPFGSGPPIGRLDSAKNQWQIAWENAQTDNQVGIPVAQVNADIATALNNWQAASPIEFTHPPLPTTLPIDIWVSFTDDPNVHYGLCRGGTCNCYDDTPELPCNTVPTIFLNPANPAANFWTDNGTVGPTQKDLISGLMHELGHALGFQHTPGNDSNGNNTGNIMQPGLGPEVRRTLTQDDRNGIRNLYDRFVPFPDNARDIGVGSNGPGTTEHVWIISNTSTTGGFKIRKWNGNRSNPAWNNDAANVGGTRIAVESGGIPWMVNASGQIFRRSSSDPTTGSWTNNTKKVTGTTTTICAKDIGAFDVNNVWVVGCDSNSTVAGHIFKWNNTSKTWDQDPHGSNTVQISVGSNGRPWQINTSGHIYRRNNNDITSTSGYTRMDNAALNATASAVAVGWENVGYVVGAQGGSCPPQIPGAGGSICVWDQQAQGLNENDGVASVKDIEPYHATGAIEIAVGPTGDLWAINTPNYNVWVDIR